MKGYFEVTAEDIRRLIAADFARRGYQVDPHSLDVPGSYAVRVAVELGDDAPLVPPRPTAAESAPAVREAAPRPRRAADPEDEAPLPPRPPPERKWNSLELSADPRLDPGELPERRPSIRENAGGYGREATLSPENPWAQGAPASGAPAPRPASATRTESLLDELYGGADGPDHPINPEFIERFARRG